MSNKSSRNLADTIVMLKAVGARRTVKGVCREHEISAETINQRNPSALPCFRSELR
jgi:hypothetical protein